MPVLLKTTSVRVSSIQIMQVRVQNKGKSVWKSRYDGDVSMSGLFLLNLDSSDTHIHSVEPKDISLIMIVQLICGTAI